MNDVTLAAGIKSEFN